MREAEETNAQFALRTEWKLLGETTASEDRRREVFDFITARNQALLAHQRFALDEQRAKLFVRMLGEGFNYIDIMEMDEIPSENWAEALGELFLLAEAFQVEPNEELDLHRLAAEIEDRLKDSDDV